MNRGKYWLLKTFKEYHKVYVIQLHVDEIFYELVRGNFFKRKIIIKVKITLKF